MSVRLDLMILEAFSNPTLGICKFLGAGLVYSLNSQHSGNVKAAMGTQPQEQDSPGTSRHTRLMAVLWQALTFSDLQFSQR